MELTAEVDEDVMYEYQLATICKTFPGYTLETAAEAPAARLLRCMKLLGIAQRIVDGESG